jgi:hypothetical protein
LNSQNTPRFSGAAYLKTKAFMVLSETGGYAATGVFCLVLRKISLVLAPFPL